eukprot:c27358_g1_i1 orf=30-3086(+)
MICCLHHCACSRLCLGLRVLGRQSERNWRESLSGLSQQQVYMRLPLISLHGVSILLLVVETFLQWTAATELHGMSSSQLAMDDGVEEGSYVGIDGETTMQKYELQEGVSLKMDPLDDKPLQLVRPGRVHDKLELSELVAEQLATIDEPVAFVGVVGPYHGGKSFLLNVLVNSSRGFTVGMRPEPETRGIWIRSIPKERLSGVDGSRVILLDTEGFYGEGTSRLYDARIFAIATLLSSHLVYNTIRTLGDAQSVSALADLAKQAQVFNLQNWLHTGDSRLDQTSTSRDVDSSLLLKTLDFPPLTWLVQGFDINLQPSEGPMNHLQRYLLAHAHTGDRTLDTLFTKGISCYTLRTPADLNFLREKYGGKGLAADEELYNVLHPSYLSDVEKLRTGVFGNLTAKGNGRLTGRTFATVLPLLIHYVNEDFPLHAERKLRDLLVDIIVDGAFAGGVEYFQKCMQDVAMKDAVIGARTGKKSVEHIKPMEAMPVLAASALTSDELELLMASAENQAIEYCKRRCVGVPQALAAMTCQGQLGVKINHMKPSYREENEHRIREVLVRLGEGLRLAAEKRILECKLPMQEIKLQHQCNQAIRDALQGYETLVGPHQGSRLYKEASARMQEEIQLKCDKVARINTEKISSIFSAAKSSFRNSYDHTFSSRGSTIDDAKSYNSAVSVEETLKEDGGQLFPPKKLHELHSVSMKVAHIAFENGIKAGGLPWMKPGNEAYDFHHFQCLQWAKQRYAEIQAYNEVLIKAFCEKSAADLIVRFKEEVSNITPFPDNDETITEKAEGIAKHLLQEYASITKDYSTSAAVEERQKELMQSIENICSHLLKKNTALMAAFCYDPLMDAYKELNMQDCERTFHNIWVSWSFWSRKCLWPGPQYMFGFRHAAYAAARKHLDKVQASVSDSKSASSNQMITKGVVLSYATRNKVIQAWIEHDLAHHANVVLVNFSILSACVIVVISFFLWTGRRVITVWKCSSILLADRRGKQSQYNDQPVFKHEPNCKVPPSFQHRHK